MATSKKSPSISRAKKSEPNGRSYVNKKQDNEVKHEPKRKTPAKSFGAKTE